MKTYGEAVEFHRHSCPGLALGYRVSLRALREFKRRSEEIYRSIVCDNCGEKVVEPKVRIKDGRLLCIRCMEGKR
ncbi:MAG: FmdE family protein [Thermodesulfovibrionales bacterium]